MFYSPYKIGDELRLTDITAIPDGAWIVRETMQFVRRQGGDQLTSITPIEGSRLPGGKMSRDFTAIYAGGPTVEKSTAIQNVFNLL